MTDPTLPQLPFTGRTADLIKAALVSFIQTTRPTLLSDFTEASLGTALIEMLAMEGGNNSYGQDVVAGEIFLSTARRRESGLRFAKSVGYVPSSAQSAVATMYALSVPAALVTYGGIFPAITTFITAANGLRYELQTALIVPIGAGTIVMSLMEGQTLTETFNPAVIQNQEIQSSQGVVQQGSWDLYVGAVVEANLWTQVSNVNFEAGPTNTYDIFFDGNGALHVRFGNGSAGAIPSDTITLIYRTSSGVAGNAAAGSISGNATATVNGGHGTASVQFQNYLLNDDGSVSGAALGGANEETLAQMQVNIPAFIVSKGVIVTSDDYNRVLAQLTQLKLTSATPWVSSYSANVMRIQSWASVPVEFSGVTEGADPLTADPVTYTQYAQIDPTIIATIQQFLAARTIIARHNVILQPEMLWIDVYLGPVLYDSAFTPQQVLDNLTQAVVSVFENASGFEIDIGTLTQQAMDAEGVLHFIPIRIVTGTQDSSEDNVATTAASTGVSGIVPVTPIVGGSLILTVAQPGGNIILQDNGAGHFTIISVGVITLVSGTINYQTGAFALVFGTALTAGQPVTANFMDILDDYRLVQMPSPDPYPAPNGAFLRVTDESQGTTAASAIQGGTLLQIPVVAGQVALGFTTTGQGVFAFIDDGAGNLVAAELPGGFTLVSGTINYTTGVWTLTLSAAVDGGAQITASYRVSGVYPPLQDIVVDPTQGANHYYDNTYFYNNEIYYNSILTTTTPVRAINLRRLFCTLNPQSA